MRIWPAAVIAAAIASGTMAAPAVASAPGSMHLGLLDSAVSLRPRPGAARAMARSDDRGRRGPHPHLRQLEPDRSPRAPQPGEDAADPAWPGYQWGALDTAVAEATARGLTPILTITAAPRLGRGTRPPSRRAAGLLAP